MPSENIQFPGHSGEMLAARLDTPKGNIHGYALFAHCFTCGKDVLAAKRICAALADRGYAVVRFDFTGLGESEGNFSDTNFSTNVADLVAAAAFMRQEYQAPSLLVGHSLGGAAVIVAAGQLDEVTAVATIAAPSEPAHVEKQFGGQVDAIREAGELEVLLGGRPFLFKKQFFDDLERNPIRQHVRTLGCALLVMHSPQDAAVNIDNAKKIYETAKHPKSFVSLDNADHLLLKRQDAQYAASVLAAWAQRYLTC
ncbi:MAG: alpha-beta hydrolase superfamily lysophospholipase [Gammaproteobacteria bacterium]|jgi:alpha-beta hydrolase superfamily lysophospholipase